MARTHGERSVQEMVEGLVRPPFPMAADAGTIAAARGFVMEMWQERHRERETEWARISGRQPGRPLPGDLSGACKFASLFAAAAFGGRVEGNELHQYAVAGGRVVDLCEGAADIEGQPGAHEHDREFFGNADHLDSLESCLPRVKAWLDAFAARIDAAPDGAAPAGTRAP